MNRASAAHDLRNRIAAAGEPHEFVSVTVAGQHFGIPVLQVQDVLGPQREVHGPRTANYRPRPTFVTGRLQAAI